MRATGTIRALNLPFWKYQVAAKGTVGVNLDVTPSPAGQKTLYEIIVNAPLKDDDCTLKIYKDSVAGGNLLFDGYMANRDANGKIYFPDGEACATKWIVVTSGGSNDLFVLAGYV